MHKEQGPSHGRTLPQTSTFLSLLVITLLAIPAMLPALRREFTCGFDNVFHLWRAVQLEELLRGGVFFSRWAPQMAHGYGYPLYLFQSPMSAYLAALLHLGGVEWVTAVNTIYALGILLSGWTMWLLTRELWGTRGAVITAVAYIYTPFHLYVVYYRASLSETAAWAIVPLIFWGLLRWQGEQKQRRGLATAVLAFITLVFTHDVTAYTFLPFLLGWTAVIALHEKSKAAWGRGLLALGLGIGGSAFFWLPAVVERHFIQFARAGSAWPFLYFNNFLPAEQLLALPRNADPLLLNDWPERGIGLFIIALAVSGTIIAWRKRPRQRWLTGFLALALAGYVFLTVGAARPLWDLISPLQLFQFPWRFLAPAAFAATLLIGGLLTDDGRRTTDNGLRSSVVRLLLLLLLTVAHWGWLYPQHCSAPADTSLTGMVAWERATHTLGTTASRELLPVTVRQMPQDDYNLPLWDNRLAPTDLPKGAHILQAEYGPLTAEIELETAVPFTARFRSFYFPGWRAWVDGEPVTITPSTPAGLITFPVPAGQHTVTVKFGESRLRLLADLISLLSVAILVMLLLRDRSVDFYQRLEIGDWRVGDLQSPSSNLLKPNHRWLLAMLGLAIVLLVGKWLLADNNYLPIHQTNLAESELDGVDNPSSLTFGNPANPSLLRLLGVDDWATATSTLFSAGIPSDQPLPITLYWQALTQPQTQTYRVGLTLVDENGFRWSEEGLRDNRWRLAAPPSTEWPIDQFVQTAFYVDALPGTPPGRYALQLSLFDQDTFAPLTIFQDGQTVGPHINLGEIELLPPQRPLPSNTLSLTETVSTGDITIWDSQFAPSTSAPGDTVYGALFWENETGIETAVILSLLNEAGETEQSWPLILPNYGAGIWRSQHNFRLPPQLSDGRYIWQITLFNGETANLSIVAINAPDRTFTAPDMDTAVNIPLGPPDQPLITLVGHSISNLQSFGFTQDKPSISLLWQAETDIPQSYRVFVQLLMPDGTVAAQSDGIPANWNRPTTGWLPGEFILDEHTLPIPPDLPPGEYTLIAGMYLPDSGRLPTPNSADFITLTTIMRD